MWLKLMPSNNGADEICEIRDKSTYAPSRDLQGLYYRRSAHAFETGAFNALLKTLEEPTENAVLFWRPLNYGVDSATILSRVQRFEFKSIKQELLKSI